MYGTCMHTELEQALMTLLSGRAGNTAPRGKFMAALLAAVGLDVGSAGGLPAGTGPPGETAEYKKAAQPELAAGEQVVRWVFPGPYGGVEPPGYGAAFGGDPPADHGIPAGAGFSGDANACIETVPGQTAAVFPATAAGPERYFSMVPSASAAAVFGTLGETPSAAAAQLLAAADSKPEVIVGRPVNGGSQVFVSIVGELEAAEANPRVNSRPFLSVQSGMPSRSVLTNTAPADGGVPGTNGIDNPGRGAFGAAQPPEAAPAGSTPETVVRPLPGPLPTHAAQTFSEHTPAPSRVQAVPDQGVPIARTPAADAGRRPPETTAAVIRATVVTSGDKPGMRKPEGAMAEGTRAAVPNSGSDAASRKPETLPAGEVLSAPHRNLQPGGPQPTVLFPEGGTARLQGLHPAEFRGEDPPKGETKPEAGQGRVVTAAAFDRQEGGPAARTSAGETPVAVSRDAAQTAGVTERMTTGATPDRPVYAPGTTPAAEPSPTPRGGGAVEVPAVARQLAEAVVFQVRRLSYGTGQSVRVQLMLDPPQLGRVTLKLTFDRNGLEAQFYTPDRAVKTVLEQALPQLREALIRQEIPLGNTSVFVGQENAQEQPAPFPRVPWPHRAFPDEPGRSEPLDRGSEPDAWPGGVDCLV